MTFPSSPAGLGSGWSLPSRLAHTTTTTTTVLCKPGPAFAGVWGLQASPLALAVQGAKWDA